LASGRSSACTTPRCSGRAVRGGKCQRCQREYDARRGSAAERGYATPRWLRLRAQVLREQPFCAWPGCIRRSVDVHHIIAKRDGGKDVRPNLQGLCHPHHSAKTMAEQRR